MRLKKKQLKIILFLLIVIAADVTFIIVNPIKRKPVVVLDSILVPLNHKINNMMSISEATTRFDKNVDNFLSRWDIKGATFAIMKDGELLYAKGYGYANVEKGEKADVKHIFRIASVSKLITATAIMKLHEDGKLQLDDKVFGENGILNDSILLNISDKRVKSITVEHLLRHRAGFSLRVGDPMFNPAIVARTLGRELPIYMDDYVEYAAEGRLRSTPGGATSYSNIGYLVLSKIIEKVTGQGYEEYIQQSILNPIGCYDMHISRNDVSKRMPNEVKYYEVHDAEPILSYDGTGRWAMRSAGGNDIEVLYGAGAWVSSSVDLLKFITAIDSNCGNNTIISKESINRMTRNIKGYLPIGWAKVNGSSEWQRTGSLSGSSAFIKRQSDGYTWVFVTNTSSWKGSAFTYYINKEISSSMKTVKSWPNQDLFVEQPNTTKFDYKAVTLYNEYCCF
ncbi:MAG: serine hydrolase domain-containing protein [Rikenellaceae bacterium]